MKIGLLFFSAGLLLLKGQLLQAQIITTIAGNHTMGFSGAGAPAVQAELGLLYGIAVDKAGNVYTADQTNNVIWRISPGGTINLYAGSGIVGYSGDGGPATVATLYAPAWLGLDPGGNLFFTDQQGIYIRKVSAAGIISTVAGNPAAHYSGGDGGPFTSATFYSIRGIVPDEAGNLYVTDHNTIRKVNPAGIINTIAGTGTSGFSGDGGPAMAAQLNEPYGVAIDYAGNIYIPDANNNVVRKINPAGIISTVAGVGESAGYKGDGGPAVDAKFDFPWALTVDKNGNVFIADEGNWEIRKIDSTGTISSYGGDHIVGYSGDGGLATAAEISYPTALAFDTGGNLYLTDLYNYVIRKISGCVAASNSGDAAVRVTTAATTVCAGSAVSFVARPFDGGADPSFQWEVNGVKAGTDSAVFNTVALNDGDVVGCLMTVGGSCGAPVSANSIVMTVNPVPVVVVMPDTVIRAGQSVVLNPTVSIGAGGSVSSYEWSPATGLSDPDIAGPVAMPGTSTTYQLTVKSNGGCSVSGRVTIGVYRELRMPNAFTPNGEGKNDVFRIPPALGVTITRFAVYNRLGGRVFMTGSSDLGWDGTANGRKQPAGEYVWQIEYQDVLTGRLVSATGTMLLIR